MTRDPCTLFFALGQLVAAMWQNQDSVPNLFDPRAIVLSPLLYSTHVFH